MKKLLAILLAVPCGLLCQTKVLNSPDYTAGSNTIWDMRNAVQTFPIRTVVTTLPATCTPPEQVTLQSGSSYTPEYCMSTNTWVPFGSSNGLTAPGSGTGVLKYTGSNATAVAGASDIYTSLGFTPIADFGGNGIPFRTAVGTSRVTIFSDITALWTGSGCSTSTNLLAVGGTCLPASSGGLADPGANSVVYRSSLNTTQPATYTNILSLWASCSGTQYLGADGNCHTPPSAGLSDPGSNGVLYRSALNTTSLATSGNVSSLWIGTGCSTGTNLLAVNGNCLPASSGGLADPGSNSIVYRSALNTTTPATSANVVSLFSGCSGTQYLGADGACHTSGAGTVTGSGLTASQPLVGNGGVAIHVDPNSDDGITQSNVRTFADTGGINALSVNAGGASPAANGEFHSFNVGAYPTAPTAVTGFQLVAPTAASAFVRYLMPPAGCNGFLTSTYTAGTPNVSALTCTALFTGVPSVPSTGYSVLTTAAGATGGWTQAETLDLASAEPNSAVTVTATTLATAQTINSITIRANEVPLGGAYRIKGLCSYVTNTSSDSINATLQVNGTSIIGLSTGAQATGTHGAYFEVIALSQSGTIATQVLSSYFEPNYWNNTFWSNNVNTLQYTSSLWKLGANSSTQTVSVVGYIVSGSGTTDTLACTIYGQALAVL